jgi:hypothetical protein
MTREMTRLLEAALAEVERELVYNATRSYRHGGKDA